MQTETTKHRPAKHTDTRGRNVARGRTTQRLKKEEEGREKEEEREKGKVRAWKKKEKPPSKARRGWEEGRWRGGEKKCEHEVSAQIN